MESDSKKLKIELTKLKNFFVNDLGTSIVSTSVKIIDVYGGLVRTTKILLSTLTSAAAGFIAYRNAALLTTIATGAWQIATMTLGEALVALRARLFAAQAAAGWIGAISAGVAALTTYFVLAKTSAKDLAEQFEENLTNLNTKSAEKLQNAIERENKETQVVLDNLDRRFQGYLQYIAKVTQSATKLAEQAKLANESNLKSFKDYIDVITEAVNKTVKEAEKRVSDLLSLAADAKKKLEDLAVNKEKDALSRKISSTNDPATQAKLLEEEITRLGTLADQAFQKGGLDQLQIAEKLFERQKDLADQLFQLKARQLDVLERQEDAAEKSRDSKVKAALAATASANNAQRAEILKLIALSEKARTDGTRKPGGIKPVDLLKFDEQDRKLKERLAKADAANEAITEQQRKINEAQAGGLKNRQEMLKVEDLIAASVEKQRLTLEKIAKTAEDERVKAEKFAAEQDLKKETFKTTTTDLIKFKPEINPTDVFGKDKNDVEAKVAEAKATALKQFDELATAVEASASKILSPEKLLELTNQLAQRRLAVEKQVDAELTAAKAQALAKQFADQQKALNDLAKEATDKQGEAKATATAQANTLIATFRSLQQLMAETKVDERFLKQAGILDQFNNIKKLIENLSKDTANPQNLTALLSEAEALEKIAKFIASLAAGSSNLPDFLKSATGDQSRKARELVDQIKASADSANKALEVVRQAAETNEAVRNQINKMAEEFKQFDAAVHGADAANTNANISMQQKLQNTIDKVRELKQAYADLANQIYTLPGAPVYSFKALGGQMLANGGQARQGLDLVNANLQRGEFVMNRGATSRFYSQLVAMNQNRQPRNFANGGNVTTVGDVSINVQGGKTEGQSIDNIVRGVQRGIRLNKYKPF